MTPPPPMLPPLLGSTPSTAGNEDDPIDRRPI